MRRLSKNILVCSFIGLLACLAVVIGGCAFLGNDFWQMYKSDRMRDASQHVPTIEVNLGVITPDKHGNISLGIAKSIQRLSAELKKNKKQINVTITWASDTNPDHMEAVVSYYSPAQMLEYSPAVLGLTYRYEQVTPNLLHGLAKRHANNFHELTKLGCTESTYDND